MKTPEQLAERREKMRLYQEQRRKDPEFAAIQRERVKQWREANREKSRAASAAWREKNPERVKAHNAAWLARHTPEQLSEHHRQCYRRTRRESHLLKTFGLTAEQYETMVTAQKGHCAICPEPDRPEKRLAVDHNHKTGKVRGLLCDPCNRGIGLLGDNPKQLRAAADYIEFHDS